MKLVRLLTLLGGCGCLLVASACSPKREKPLVIGLELDYPPFEMTDPQGRPSGISVEMARALATSLGREVALENIPFDGLIPALKTGKIDLIISSMTITTERAESIDFSDPYVKTGICLLVRKTAPIERAADLNHPEITIAVKKGTTGHLYAAANLPRAALLVLDKDASCALEVAQGKADAFIYDQLSVYQNWQRHPETTRPILEPIRTEYWGIGIRKGNDELRSQVNDFLRDFRAADGFSRLGDKYLREQKKTFEEMGVTFLF